MEMEMGDGSGVGWGGGDLTLDVMWELSSNAGCFV